MGKKSFSRLVMKSRFPGGLDIYDKLTENSEPPLKRLVLAFSEHFSREVLLWYKNCIYVVVLYDNNLGMTNLNYRIIAPFFVLMNIQPRYV